MINLAFKDVISSDLFSPRRKTLMVSYVNALLYGVGGIVVAGMALLVAFQERLVYVPVLPGLTKSYAITPARLRLIYEDVWLRSADGVQLHAWFIKLFPDCRGSSISPSSLCLVLLHLILLPARIGDRGWRKWCIWNAFFASISASTLCYSQLICNSF